MDQPDKWHFRCLALSEISIEHEPERIILQALIKDVNEGYKDTDCVYFRDMNDLEKDEIRQDVIDCLMRLGQGRDCHEFDGEDTHPHKGRVCVYPNTQDVERVIQGFRNGANGGLRPDMTVTVEIYIDFPEDSSVDVWGDYQAPLWSTSVHTVPALELPPSVRVPIKY